MSRYAFGPFSLDREARILIRDGEPVPIAAKNLDTLVVLLENRGRLVDKDELLSRVWPGVVVEEANLNQSIFTVRKILGDTPKDHRYIATVPGRGYQFVAQVTEIENRTSSAAGGVIAGKRTKRAVTLTILALSLGCVTWFALRRSPKSPRELTQKRVTFNSSARTVESSAISPDGKYIAYSDVSGIHVKLLSTGEERTLSLPEERSAGAISYVASWFPDGTQLLGNSTQSDDRASIWTLSVMGRSFRELRRDAWAWQVSPDGAHIAFSPKQPFEDAHEISITGAEEDKPQKVLGLANGEWLCSVHWSPDGRRLAYIRAQNRSDKYCQWIESCDLNGGNRTSLLTVSAQDPWVQDIAWLPDGRLIYSRRESIVSADDANLWQITVDLRRGLPTSRPRRMTGWAGSNLVGLTTSADGSRIAFRREIPETQVWLGDLSSPGHLEGTPRRLINDEIIVSPGDWTADSKAVIFESDWNGKPNIFKQSIIAAEPEPLVVGQKGAGVPRISPDGAWVLYAEREAASANSGTPKYRLMRVPASGGSPQFVLETQNATVSRGNFNCSRSPANVCVLREASTDQKRLMLLAFDPNTGTQKMLRWIDPGFDGMLSPDGTIYAGATGGQVDSRIRFLSLIGGPDQEITVNGWPNLSSFDWAADGKGFYSGSVSPEGSTLLYLDLHGTPHVVWRSRESIGCFGLPSPDNRYLAIVSWVNNSDVWTVENP